MGFRFYNLNSVYKSYSVFRMSSNHKIVHHPTTLLLIQPLNDNPHYKIPRRWHLGHSHDHHDNHRQLSGKEGENVFRLGLASDIGLATGKAFTGYLTGSTAIIADAAHSISDVVISCCLIVISKILIC